MSYPTDTVLVRRESLGDALDHVRVVGNSPIRSARVGEWTGETGSDVIVNAIDEFAAPATLPESVLNREYDIESMPEESNEVVIDPRRARGRVSQIAPEESLRRQAAAAEAAKDEDKPEKPTRGKTAIKAG